MSTKRVIKRYEGGGLPAGYVFLCPFCEQARTKRNVLVNLYQCVACGHWVSEEQLESYVKQMIMQVWIGDGA